MTDTHQTTNGQDRSQHGAPSCFVDAATAQEQIWDYVLVGGGLSNAMIAIFLTAHQPERSVLILEKGSTLGGNHTWSFHSTDVDPSHLDLISPYLIASWPRQEVRFPAFKRVLRTGYHAMSSDKLHDGFVAGSHVKIILDADVADLNPSHVSLKTGEQIAARAVIDGRGFVPNDALLLGYQKFVGVEYELTEPHGETHPVIMDATVAQTDGYRFIYTLPFTPTRILVEDTYYSDGPEMDHDQLGSNADDYARQKGWQVASVARREHGILPIALAGDIAKFWRASTDDIARVGLRAALFHPTTGYSLPDAVALAGKIAANKNVSSPAIARLVRQHSKTTWSRRRFFRLLNRFLFDAAKPSDRWSVMQRFYGLPVALIERFYAGNLTVADQGRILFGKPPVPLLKAIQCLREEHAWAKPRQT